MYHFDLLLAGMEFAILFIVYKVWVGNYFSFLFHVNTSETAFYFSVLQEGVQFGRVEPVNSNLKVVCVQENKKTTKI